MTSRRCRPWFAAVLAVGATWLAVPVSADAFCGFYVNGGDAPLFNEATVVVLAREGERTVLSMQNDYEGPPQDFAMVVPVPVVLHEKDVRTLQPSVFEEIGTMSAPRLVEYWEQDPCAERRRYKDEKKDGKKDDGVKAEPAEDSEAPKVVVEAQFAVGEYEVVILGATDSRALEGWLRAHHYRIPDGAAQVLRPYVAEGMKFFVAKVDVEQVRWKDGRAVLSPLRFHYDSDTFRLPIRLGMLNAKERQDLVIHILAPRQRYAVANRDNVVIPTNLDVDAEVEEDFAGFYAALFDRVVAEHPGAVVTEYAWTATDCDPCPGPPLSAEVLATVGADLLESGTDELVLTRLHARYDASDPGEDLVFEQAPPIRGGNEWSDDAGVLSTAAVPSRFNMFQARYAVRHAWTGAVQCDEPTFGVWGPNTAATVTPARDVAFAARSARIVALVDKALQPKPGQRAAAMKNEPLSPLLGLGLIVLILGTGVAVHRRGVG